MKVVVCTGHGPEYQELADVTRPSVERYCEKRGYDFLYDNTRTDKDFGKIALYREAYATGRYGVNDVFVWIDTDAQVQNSDIRVEDICTAFLGDGHFLWSYDYAGPNSGVYITRFSPQGAHWLDRVNATMAENGWGDETAMETLMLSPPFRDWVRVCPGVFLNAYDYTFYGWDHYGHGETINKYEPGRFILHMPGYPNEQRIPELTRRAAEAT